MQGYKLLILRNYVEYDHNQNEQIICCEKLADEQGGLYSSDWIDGCFLDPAGMGSKVEEINFFSQVDKFSNLRQ
jgi:hypothetical protein